MCTGSHRTERGEIGTSCKGGKRGGGGGREREKREREREREREIKIRGDRGEHEREKEGDKIIMGRQPREKIKIAGCGV